MKKGDLLGVILTLGILAVMIGGGAVNYVDELQKIHDSVRANDTLMRIMWDGKHFVSEKYRDEQNRTYTVKNGVLTAYFGANEGEIRCNEYSCSHIPNEYYSVGSNDWSGFYVFRTPRDMMKYEKRVMDVGKGKAYFYAKKVETPIGEYRNVYVRVNNWDANNNQIERYSNSVVYCYLDARGMDCYFTDVKNRSVEVNVSGDFEIINYSQFHGNWLQEVAHDVFNVFGLYDHIAFGMVQGMDTDEVYMMWKAPPERILLSEREVQYAYFVGGNQWEVRDNSDWAGLNGQFLNPAKAMWDTRIVDDEQYSVVESIPTVGLRCSEEYGGCQVFQPKTE